MNNHHVVAWDGIVQTKSANGVAKRLIEGLSADLVMVHVAGGTQGERHSHPHEQFVQVAQGSGRLETEQGIQKFGPGSVFHFPADAWHIASFDIDTVLVETNLRS